VRRSPAMSLGRALRCKLGYALVQFAHGVRAVHDLPGGKLRLTLGEGFKPPSGGDGGGGVSSIGARPARWFSAMRRVRLKALHEGPGLRPLWLMPVDEYPYSRTGGQRRAVWTSASTHTVSPSISYTKR